MELVLIVLPVQMQILAQVVMWDIILLLSVALARLAIMPLAPTPSPVLPVLKLALFATNAVVHKLVHFVI